MIGYITGKIIDKESDQILLLAGHIGYEILVDPVTLSRISIHEEKETALYIYYHVTERQPKPVLIGFLEPTDKAFFQLFITVAAIGPMKAVKALTQPVAEVARAIENKDVEFLARLSGIGKRTAEKIIATLNGKVGQFMGKDEIPPAVSVREPEESDLRQQISSQVADVLTEQLGHSITSARRMIAEAFSRNPRIDTPEDLFDEIYRESN